MSMEKVISYLGTNRGDGRKKNLNRMRDLLNELNNPQESLNFIHITGTNGKGSTAAIFQSVLREAGLTVGLFSSPHLEFINERIRINDEFISDDELIQIVHKMEPVILEVEKRLGEKFYAFELLTVASFMYFQGKNLDVVILEAGIGGRLDATNVINQSVLSIITSIGLDHLESLGNSKEAIMQEKVQILKEKSSMVIGPIEENLKKIADTWAKKVEGELIFVNKDDIHLIESTEDYQLFDYGSYQNIKLPLLGVHQLENACLVIEGAQILSEQGYPITEEDIYQGLATAFWPGRFEKVSENPLFYMDGAHNDASVDRLIETLNELFPNETFHFVVGMMKDKDYKNLLKKVYPLAKSFLLISPDPNRGFDTAEVTNLIAEEGIQVAEAADMKEVLTYVETQIPKDEIVIQFGSLYLVGALKEAQCE